jgi:hypothetical protein
MAFSSFASDRKESARHEKLDPLTTSTESTLRAGLLAEGLLDSDWPPFSFYFRWFVRFGFQTMRYEGIKMYDGAVEDLALLELLTRFF